MRRVHSGNMKPHRRILPVSWRVVVEKPYSVMVTYISLIRTPLPPLAAQGWAIAKAFREGKATAEERAKIIASMVNVGPSHLFKPKTLW